MNYLETLRAVKADLTPARELEGNAVRIMTFHKSKGLEFPVVIIADMFSRFISNTSNSIVWNENYGIGLDFVDTKRRVRYPSMPKTVVNSQVKRNELSEEMRLLYVAMTRAAEKLIIFCGFRGKTAKVSSAVKTGGVLPRGYVESCNCTRDWVLPAVLPENTDLDALLENGGELKIREGFAARVKVISDLAGSENPFAAEETEAAPETMPAADKEAIAARLSYVYPRRGLGAVPAKLSVSEIKRRTMADDDVYVPKIRSIEDITLREPRAEHGQERGTVTHFVMQHLDMDSENTSEQIGGQLKLMIAEGMITEEQADLVDVDAIAHFFKGELAARIRAADEVRREFKFYTELNARELYPDLNTDGSEPILIQGVVDCFFIERGGAVILDYKTDNVTSDRVNKYAERYRVQLEYYERGISRILKIPVIGKYLYFFACGETVEM